MKFKEWIKTFFAGAAMGVASAIPGVSGGTIAVIVKIYQKIIDSVSNITKHFVKSFLTLLPIGLGVICALIPCILLFDLAFEGFVFGIVSLFAGLIIGSFPGIIDEVRHDKVKPSSIITLVIAMLIAIGLGVASVLLGGKLDLSAQVANPDWWFYLVLIPVGAIAAVALIVPGISGSMLLLVLGFYNPLIEGASDWMKNIVHGDFTNFWPMLLILVCFAVGIIIGFLTIAKLMSFLLKKYHHLTFYGIIGFIIGSTITLYFNNEIYNYYLIWGAGDQVWMPWWVEVIIGLVLLGLGAFGSYMLVRVGRKHKEQENSNEEPKEIAE